MRTRQILEDSMSGEYAVLKLAERLLFVTGKPVTFEWQNRVITMRRTEGRRFSLTEEYNWQVAKETRELDKIVNDAYKTNP